MIRVSTAMPACLRKPIAWLLLCALFFSTGCQPTGNLPPEGSKNDINNLLDGRISPGRKYKILQAYRSGYDEHDRYFEAYAVKLDESTKLAGGDWSKTLPEDPFYKEALKQTESYRDTIPWFPHADAMSSGKCDLQFLHLDIADDSVLGADLFVYDPAETTIYYIKFRR